MPESSHILCAEGILVSADFFKSVKGDAATNTCF
jgi:hypothetical protein